MKHISIYILTTVISTFSLEAQVVSINTNNPASNTAWHVDGAGDNSTTITTSQTENDVVVLSDGKMGIGNISPSVQLDIKTRTVAPFILEDGWQAQDRALTSDGDGNGRWQPFGASYVQSVNTNTQVPFILSNVLGKYMYSGIAFSLPPGLWMIEPNILIYRNVSITSTNKSSFYDRAWIKSIISDSETVGVYSADYLAGGPKLVCSFLYAVGAGFNMMNGFFFINNKSGDSKVYYYWFGNVSNLGLEPNSQFYFAGKNESFMTATYMGEPR